ncbi:MAG: hypothetical protein RIS45_943, partial [Planctomycetota bacterium]
VQHVVGADDGRSVDGRRCVPRYIPRYIPRCILRRIARAKCQRSACNRSASQDVRRDHSHVFATFERPPAVVAAFFAEDFFAGVFFDGLPFPFVAACPFVDASPGSHPCSHERG